MMKLVDTLPLRWTTTAVCLVPEMTYKVSSGTLSLYSLTAVCHDRLTMSHSKSLGLRLSFRRDLSSHWSKRMLRLALGWSWLLSAALGCSLLLSAAFSCSLLLSAALCCSLLLSAALCCSRLLSVAVPLV